VKNTTKCAQATLYYVLRQFAITPNGPGAALYTEEDILYLLTGGYIYTLKIYERRKKNNKQTIIIVSSRYIYIHIYNLSIMACVSCVILAGAGQKLDRCRSVAPIYIFYYYYYYYCLRRTARTTTYYYTLPAIIQSLLLLKFTTITSSRVQLVRSFPRGD